MSRIIVAIFIGVVALVAAISLYTNLANRDAIPPPPAERRG
ncbi:MAG TPA: hypothetical protein VD906_15940 [Caulobacteraceae bacterium]|nr:hypothetical protein [Caulobacteraceae bacterium]